MQHTAKEYWEASTLGGAGSRRAASNAYQSQINWWRFVAPQAKLCGNDCLPLFGVRDGEAKRTFTGFCGEAVAAQEVLAFAAIGLPPSERHVLEMTCGNSDCCNVQHMRWALLLRGGEVQGENPLGLFPDPKTANLFGRSQVLRICDGQIADGFQVAILRISSRYSFGSPVVYRVSNGETVVHGFDGKQIANALKAAEKKRTGKTVLRGFFERPEIAALAALTSADEALSLWAGPSVWPLRGQPEHFELVDPAAAPVPVHHGAGKLASAAAPTERPKRGLMGSENPYRRVSAQMRSGNTF